MPFTLPTPADIKLDFPAFAAVDDAIIQRLIDLRVPMWVDTSWLESDYTYAAELVVAHYLTLSGLGTGTDAEMNAQGLSGVSRLKSGTLDVTFKDAAGDSGDSSGFSATRYGQQFLALLRKQGKTVSIARGAVGCIAGQSTDVPWAWRTNGWGL